MRYGDAGRIVESIYPKCPFARTVTNSVGRSGTRDGSQAAEATLNSKGS
jgi:hypothetical protein